MVPVSLRFQTRASGLRFDLRTPEPEENLELGVESEEAPDGSDAAPPPEAPPESPADGVISSR